MGEKNVISEIKGCMMLNYGVLLPARCWFQASECTQCLSDTELG